MRNASLFLSHQSQAHDRPVGRLLRVLARVIRGVGGLLEKVRLDFLGARNLPERHLKETYLFGPVEAL